MRHHSIARIFTDHHGSQCERLKKIHRDIFQTVDGDLSFAFKHSGFKFFNEQTFSSDLGERDIQNFVAFGS